MNRQGEEEQDPEGGFARALPMLILGLLIGTGFVQFFYNGNGKQKGGRIP